MRIRLGLLPLLLATQSCASCFPDTNGTPTCEGWGTAAPVVAADPAWGVAGTPFTFTHPPVEGADDYEAEVAFEPYPTWTSLPADAGSVTFTPATPGRYEARVRALRDGCEATAWGTSPSVEVRMTWIDAEASGHWSGRVNHESVVFGGQVWVLGGFTDTESSDEIWTSTDGTAWTERVPTTPHWNGRGAFEAVVFDDRIWVLGGQTTTGQRNDVWWSGDGLAWNLATSNAGWSERSSHEVAAFDNALWLTGGARWVGPTNDDWSHYDDVWTSGDGITWVMVTSSAPWAPRAQHAFFVYDGRLWISGGGEFGAGGAFHDDIWSSEDGSVWTEESSTAAWGPRMGHSVDELDGRLWLVSGAQTGLVEFRDAWVSADGVQWNELAGFGDLWTGRKYHTSVVFGGRIWVMGGWSMGIGRVDDVWIGP